MSVDRVINCDVCGVEVMRLLPSENLEDEMLRAGAVPASIHKDGKDLCIGHALADNNALRAVERHLVRTEMDSMHLPV